MRARTQAVCPVCAKNVQVRAENPAFPFCSPSCKLVDLGRWLDGAYRIPSRMSEDGGQADGLDPESDPTESDESPQIANSEEPE